MMVNISPSGDSETEAISSHLWIIRNERIRTFGFVEIRFCKMKKKKLLTKVYSNNEKKFWKYFDWLATLKICVFSKVPELPMKKKIIFIVFFVSQKCLKRRL